MPENKITALIAKPGQWRLLRDISHSHMLALEAEGWWVKAMWSARPSVAAVLVSARHI
jgi:hypothetical protein